MERSKYLFSPWFIGALIILICNDFWWKYAYSNALTGKLSDLSGVLVLGLLFNFVSERKRWLNALFVIVFFTFWKSPLSEGLIVSWNSLGVFPIARVVDYSDLWAFVMLPIVSHKTFLQKNHFPRWQLNIVLSVSLFALASTSRYRGSLIWEYSQPIEVLAFTTSASADELFGSLKEDFNLSLKRQDSVYVSGQLRTRYVFMSQADSPYVLVDSLHLIHWPDGKRYLHVEITALYTNPKRSALELHELSTFKKIYDIRNPHIVNQIVVEIPVH